MKKLSTKREISEYKSWIRDIMSCHGLYNLQHGKWSHKD